MSPSIVIERVQEDDLDELTRLLHANKLALSINRLIIKDWPNDEAQRKLYRGAVEGALHSNAIEDWKAVDKDTGKTAGYVAFTIQEPKNEDIPLNEGSQGQTPEGVVPEVLQAVNGATNVINKATPNVKRMELVYIGVVKTYRRQGVGSLLLRKCTDKAKELGLPIIVHAEPAARKFFDHHALQEFAHGEVDLSQFAAPHSGFGMFRLTGMMLNK